MSEIAELEAAIAALEAQRGVLGDGVVDAAVGPMREKLAGLLETEATPQVPADDGERKFVTMIFADLSGSTPGEIPETAYDIWRIGSRPSSTVCTGTYRLTDSQRTS